MKPPKLYLTLGLLLCIAFASAQTAITGNLKQELSSRKAVRPVQPSKPQEDGSRSGTYNVTLDYDGLDELYATGFGFNYQRYVWEVNKNYTNGAAMTLQTAAIIFDSLFYYTPNSSLVYHPYKSSTVKVDSISFYFSHTNNTGNADSIFITVFDTTGYSISGTGPAGQVNTTPIWDTVIVSTLSLPITSGGNFTELTVYPGLQLAQGMPFGVKVDFAGDTANKFSVLAGYRDECGDMCFAEPSRAGAHALYYLNLIANPPTGQNLSGVYNNSYSVFYDCDQSSDLTPGACEHFPIQNFAFIPYLTVVADTQIVVSSLPAGLNNLSVLLYRDINQNGVSDSSDAPIMNKKIMVGPFNLYATLPGGVAYKLLYDGTYTVTPPQLTGFNLSGPASVSITLGNQADTLLAFAYTIGTPSDSVEITSAIAPTVCSNDVALWVTVSNNGNIAQTLRATLYVDTPVNIISANGANPVTNKQATWTITNMQPLTQASAYALLEMPNFSFMGDTLDYILQLERFDGTNWSTIGDYILREQIVCSYDPNDKQVQPQGEIYQNLTLMNTPLHYRVRFQNTGNFPAAKVEIRDTLDAGLDYSTFRLLSASHPVEVEVTNDRYVAFIFNNINLPDSGLNEPGSHGYVLYAIEPKANMVPGTSVENTAHIYFDFNPAVVTNTTSTEYVTQFPTGISTISADGSLTAVPNPFAESTMLTWKGNSEQAFIKIYNLQGEVVISEQTTGNNFVVHKNALLPGIYLVQVNAEAAYSMKLMVR